MELGGVVVADPDAVEDAGERVGESAAGDHVLEEAEELGVVRDEVVAVREPVPVQPVVADGGGLRHLPLVVLAGGPRHRNSATLVGGMELDEELPAIMSSRRRRSSASSGTKW